MADRRMFGLGAIGTGLLALATILFNNLEPTQALLLRAKESGGAPKMIADLVTNPAFQLILVVVTLLLCIRAVPWRGADVTTNQSSSGETSVVDMDDDSSLINLGSIEGENQNDTIKTRGRASVLNRGVVKGKNPKKR